MSSLEQQQEQQQQQSSSKHQQDRKCMPFPLKLRTMLDECVANGLEHVVSWEMEGLAFKVHRPKEFVHHIMPRYFNQTKYKSFQRQLNLYGFSRITRGPDKGCYLHELFSLHQHLSACKEITRKKSVDDNTFPTAEDVDDLAPPTWLPASMVVEPDPIQEQQQQQEQEQQLQLQQETSSSKQPEQPKVKSSMMDAFENYFQSNVVGQPQQPEDDLKKPAPQKPSAMTKTPDPGNALQRMLDSFLEPKEAQQQQKSPTATTTDEEDQFKKKYQRAAVFPDKLQDMLEYSERNNLTHVVSWQMKGRAFKVHNIELFMKHVMHKFFKQTKYESLQRQLNLYGFTRIPKGPMKGCYHHPLFLKGGRPLSRGMMRRKPEEGMAVLPQHTDNNKLAIMQHAPPKAVSIIPDETTATQPSVFDQLTRAARLVEEVSSSSLLEPTPIGSSSSESEPQRSAVLPWDAENIMCANVVAEQPKEREGRSYTNMIPFEQGFALQQQQHQPHVVGCPPPSQLSDFLQLRNHDNSSVWYAATIHSFQGV
jgi:hypothetical protein